MNPTRLPSDRTMTFLRETSQLLCHCPGCLHPDPAFPAQCVKCLRRIDRRYDSEIQHPSQEDSE